MMNYLCTQTMPIYIYKKGVYGIKNAASYSKAFYKNGGLPFLLS